VDAPPDRITITDIARAGYCPSGAKRWFSEQGLDFRAFLKDGMGVDEFLATGDAQAERTRLRRDDGADAPGYRGLTSIFFTGRPDAHKGKKGFYWTANNPYLPPIWVTVERAPVGLTPGYALVPRAGTTAYPFDIEDTDQSSGADFLVSAEAELMAFVDTDYEWWDLNSHTKLGTSGAVSLFGGSSMMAEDGIVYEAGAYVVGVDVAFALFITPPMGGTTHVDFTDLYRGTLRVFDDSSGTRHVYTGTHVGGYVDYTVRVVLPDAYCDFFRYDEDDIWAVVQPTGSSNLIGLSSLSSGTTHWITGLVTRGSPNDATACYNVIADTFLIYSDAKYYIVDGQTFAIVASGSPPWSGGKPDLTLNIVDPSKTSFWMTTQEVSTATGQPLRTVSGWDTGQATHVSTFDPVQRAIISRPQFVPDLYWLYLDRGEMDANPAHVIYEALTNVIWGMGSPSSLIDVDSFEDAGVALYNEPLGLSLIWIRQSTLQDFIQEVLDHIQAVLFVDPQTGLLTLKLIRGDYDVADLPTISPSTANLTNFGRKLWGDIVNEITVTWTNPDNEQDETVTVHDLASISTQGSIVPDSRNYYGVRYASLAQRLAARDLRSAGAPLATCEAEVDRSLWFLRPASVLLLDWPEYGVDGVVMRVTSIDYGKPGDPIIKLGLIEDVFGLDIGDYVDPPGSAWEDTSAPPSALDQQEAITLPYYFAANGVSSIVGADYPEALAGVLGASSNEDVYAIELWAEVTLPDSSTEWQSVATLNVLARGELDADLAAETSSTGVAFTNYIGTVLPSVPGFAIIGAAGEDQNEIAMLTGTGYALTRGVLDTVPRAWPAGTPVWFVATDSLIEDPTTHSVGEVVQYRLLTRTSQGLLSLYGAPPLSYTMSERPWLPSRPANVSIDAVSFNDITTPVDMIGESVAPVTWSNRNRLNEDAVVLGWADSTVTPETGQTTTIRVLKTDGTTVVTTHSGLTGTTFDIPIASFASNDIAIVEVAAARTDADGTFESLQAHRLFVQVGNLTFDETGVTFDSTTFNWDAN
jgi:hypothetical protein